MSDAPDELGQLRVHVRSLQAEVDCLASRVRDLERGVSSPSPGRTSDASFGLTAVNRIGALTLAIGVIFFFRYAVDNDWIGAFGRVAAGLICGLLLIAAAEWLHRKAQRTFGQGIAGCGVATLYISLYSAFGYYRLIPQTSAFIALIAVCACAVALSFRYASAAIAALGLLAALLTPLLLRVPAPLLLPNALYLFLLDLTCIAIAVQRRWTSLVPLLTGATILTAFILFDASHPEAFVLFALALAVLHAAASFRSSELAGLRDALYLSASGCFITAVLRELALRVADNVAPLSQASVMSELGSVFLGIYGVAALIYAIARHSRVNRRLALFLLGLVIAKLYFWDVWFLERFYRTTAFVSLGVILLAASWIYSRSKPREGSANAITASPPGAPQ